MLKVVRGSFEMDLLAKAQILFDIKLTEGLWTIVN